MKHVLIIGMSDNMGGVENFIMNYYRMIDKTLVQFDFLIFQEHCIFEQEIKQLGGSIYSVIEPRFRHVFAFQRARKKFFTENAWKYCAVWLNDCSLANVTDLAVAKEIGIQCRIFHSHNSQPMKEGKTKLFYLFLHKLNRFRVGHLATDYWTCSESAGRFCFPERIRKSKAYKIIPNAINMNKYTFSQSIRDDYRDRLGLNGKFVIGNIGRLHFQKNQLFLLDIFAEIIKKEPDAFLLLVGEGEKRKEIEDKIAFLHLGKSVHLLGMRKDIPELLQSMDCFVFPSRFEGFGIALLEAQASGLRAFASKDVIPNAVKITELLDFIPLEVGAAGWSDQILAYRNYDRKDMYRVLRDSKYNMENSVKVVEGFFSSI